MSIAAAFYGFTPILIPQGQSLEKLAELLNRTQADVLVAAAGTIPLKELAKHYSGLKQVVWVVERLSRHMDWNEVPEGFGGKADVLAWHDIVDQKEESNSSEVPIDDSRSTKPSIVTVSQNHDKGADGYEIVKFTSEVRGLSFRWSSAVLIWYFRTSWPQLQDKYQHCQETIA